MNDISLHARCAIPLKNTYRRPCRRALPLDINMPARTAPCCGVHEHMPYSARHTCPGISSLGAGDRTAQYERVISLSAFASKQLYTGGGTAWNYLYLFMRPLAWLTRGNGASAGIALTHRRITGWNRSPSPRSVKIPHDLLTILAFAKVPGTYRASWPD